VKNWTIQINCDHCNSGGDFLQEYVIIMHQYFDKNQNSKNEYINFYKFFDMFSCIIISCTCDLHMGQKSKPNEYKQSIEWPKKIVLFLATPFK
jgi:hypothetical protein